MGGGGGAAIYVILEVPLKFFGRVGFFSIFAPMEQKLLDLERLLSLEAK